MNVLQHTRNERNPCYKQNRPDRSYRDTLLSLDWELFSRLPKIQTEAEFSILMSEHFVGFPLSTALRIQFGIFRNLTFPSSLHVLHAFENPSYSFKTCACAVFDRCV